MTLNQAIAILADLPIPGSVAHNAAGLIANYGYPLESAVKRATLWHVEAERARDLHPTH